MTNLMAFELIGVGNPIMDILAHVDDAFLRQHVTGDKGGMVLVDHSDINGLLGRLGSAVATAPGGSAANATLGAAHLVLKTTYLGKIGADKTAEDYRANFKAAGGDDSRFKHATMPHGRCLSMVTPDGQRTMRTHLGAAMTLSPDEISAADFAGAKHAHIEGYLLFNPSLAQKVIDTARAAGCTISLELSSFEVVNVARDWILEQLRLGVDIVFAKDDELHRIAPVVVPQVTDTTGAGDAWAAGFLFGHLRGKSLAGSGALGSALGAECVQHLGASIPESRWPHLRALAGSLK